MKKWIQRLRGEGAALVVQLSPAECREMAKVFARAQEQLDFERERAHCEATGSWNEPTVEFFVDGIKVTP